MTDDELTQLEKAWQHRLEIHRRYEHGYGPQGRDAVESDHLSDYLVTNVGALLAEVRRLRANAAMNEADTEAVASLAYETFAGMAAGVEAVNWDDMTENEQAVWIAVVRAVRRFDAPTGGEGADSVEDTEGD